MCILIDIKGDFADTEKDLLNFYEACAEVRTLTQSGRWTLGLRWTLGRPRSVRACEIVHNGRCDISSY